jgi:phosphatidylglycerophosphate synthase
VFAYQTFDALDGIQARRTMNTSPVGALWDHACDNVGIVFVSLVGCYVTGIRNFLTMWYVVQVAALMLLLVHLEGLRTRKLRYGKLTGPGEGIFVFEVIMLSCAFFGTDRMLQVWLSVSSLPVLQFILRPQVLYYCMVVLVCVKTLQLDAQHKETRNGVLFCLLFRVMPALLFRWGWVQSESLLNVVCDGLFVSVMATDIALCKMAHPRNMHPWLWVFAMASVLDYLVIVALVCAYHLILFVELTTFLKLPMFTLAVNVYVDGVYDL